MAQRKKPVKRAAKKRKTIENDETCLQMHAWAWVTKTYPELLIFHVANERQAAVQYHVKLKRLGVLKGTPDFLAFPNSGRGCAIEMKDDEGTQDKDQEHFQRRWEQAGGRYFLVCTLADFKNIVTGFMIFG